MNAKQSNKDKICVYSQFFTAMAKFLYDGWYLLCDHSQKQPALVMIGIVNPIGIVMKQDPHAGLSLRAGGRGFSPATKRVAPGYFYWKIEEK